MMEQAVSGLLGKEKRRRRLMFGAVTLGIAIIAISTRSERAMFGAGQPMPGVFATISTPLGGAQRASLRDRDPSAFFAGLDRGVREPAGPFEDGPIGPIDSAFMFVGPGDGLPPGQLDPVGLMNGPQLFGDPTPYREPEMSDPSYVTRQNKPASSSTGGGSTSGGNPGGGSNGGGGNNGSSGDPGSSSGDPGNNPGGNPGGPGSNPGDPGGNPGGVIDPPPPPHTGVPEPATWALMITGFLAIGAMMRRRRAKELGAALGNQG